MNVYRHFALYIFSRNARFLNVPENMYNVKITFIMAQRTSYAENANMYPSEIAQFPKSAKLYT